MMDYMAWIIWPHSLIHSVTIFVVSLQKNLKFFEIDVCILVGLYFSYLSIVISVFPCMLYVFHLDVLLVNLNRVGDEREWVGIPSAGAVRKSIQSWWLYSIQCEHAFSWSHGEYRPAVRLLHICFLCLFWV